VHPSLACSKNKTTLPAMANSIASRAQLFVLSSPASGRSIPSDSHEQIFLLCELLQKNRGIYADIGNCL
jgi:hypothetical protein